MIFFLHDKSSRRAKRLFLIIAKKVAFTLPADTFLIIDGNSLAYRAFHALPLLSTSQGVITNAVYGFTNMLLKVLARQPVQMVAVCFDKGKTTFRHKDYSDYKGNRKPTPDELRPQFPLLKELLLSMRIQILELENYEADDLIGTLTAHAEKAGLTSIILTGDRDALQLVSPMTNVLLIKKGITELEVYTEEKVQEHFGVAPARFTDLKGLMGDQSDNIPGIPGIGPKTAVNLLKRYNCLEEIISHLEELPSNLKEKIQKFAQQSILSKQLATVSKDAPTPIELNKYYWQGPNYQELLGFYSKLEFKGLIRSITQPDKKGKKNSRKKKTSLFEDEFEKVDTYQVGYHQILRREDLNRLLGAVHRAGQVAVAVEGNRENGPTAAALAIRGDLQSGDENITVQKPLIAYLSLITENDKANLEALQTICADQMIKKVCHNGKNLILLFQAGHIAINNLAFDTMIAAYLLNPGSPNHDLPDLALEHLNVILPVKGAGSLPAQADAISQLAGLLEEKLRLQETGNLFYQIEMPLVRVLAKMEMAGVAVNTQQLSVMSEELALKINDLTQQIYEMAGEQFNINSTKQLSQILFEKLQLPVIKRIKTGYSTDAGVLEELAGSHQIVSKILEHRQLVKLKSTYVDGLSALINPRTGRLHTTFQQAVTATGRLSSTDPNLQNIPIRLEEGKKIRQVFIPRYKDNLILTADYSQIELRLLAHMSGDLSLKEAFRQNEDIHTRTASEVFGISIAEVTEDMRTRAKAVNFGIIYGISDFGLSRNIKVSRQEAKQYIEKYFNRYLGVQEYIERNLRKAREKGYVTTILKRRRYLPDLFSPIHSVRSSGERTAINTPIQGSAADIIKLAMIHINHELKERNLKTKMILQVHDELIFDVPKVELKEVQELVRNCMENAIVLDVPLLVDIKLGPNWYEVKKVNNEDITAK